MRAVLVTWRDLGRIRRRGSVTLSWRHLQEAYWKRWRMGLLEGKVARDSCCDVREGRAMEMVMERRRGGKNCAKFNCRTTRGLFRDVPDA